MSRVPPHRSSVTSLPGRQDLASSPMAGAIVHRPVLDGLRGVAVAMVVVYHLRPGALPGGFIGVDVFFVLSGYLITSLLLIEADQTGRIDLRRFVGRRARRLVPAMLMLVATMALYGATWANPFELQRLRAHGVATVLSFANWRFVAEGVTYTDVVAGASPLRHVWSLSIEEQFYLVLPVVLFLAASIAGVRLRRTVLWGALICAAASAAWSAWLSAHDADLGRTYFGTDTRAHALLLGVALGALQLGRPAAQARRRPAAALAIAGLATLAVLAWAADERSAFMPRVGFLVAAVASAAVIAGVEHVGPARRLLSTRPLVGLGLISYGVYLWHWPVVVILDSARTGLAPGSVGLFALQLAVTLGVAMSSYFLLERPIRSGALQRRLGSGPAMWAWPAATAIAVVALVVATVAVPTSAAPAATMAAPATTPDAPMSTAGAPATTTATSSIATLVTTTTPAAAVRMVVFGDSVAHSLAGGEMLAFPDFTPWTPDQAVVSGLLSLARPGCSFLPGEVAVEDGARGADLGAFCGDWRADLDAGLSSHHATHLVVLLSNDMYDRYVDGRFVRFGSAEHVALLGAFLDELAATASAHGARLVLLAPAPRMGEFAIAEDHAAAMLEVLRGYTSNHDVDLLSLSDAPSTERYDGTHYGWEQARTVLTWVAAQVSTG